MAADAGGSGTPAPVPLEDATRLPGAARVRSGASHHTAIVTGYETREIVVASGIEFRSEDYQATMRQYGLDHTGLKRHGLVSLTQGLERWVPGFHATSHTTGEYLSRRQGVRFLLRNVTTKPALKQALETPGIHVIYNGHARYGRGPCFGPIGHPHGDWWENGDADHGIFRMGYPFIGVPAGEIVSHGYHARLALAADGPLTQSDCEPELAAYVGRVRATQAADLGAGVAALLIDAAGGPLATDTPCWAYQRPYEGRANVRFVVLRAGWQNTAAAPADLGATQMRCKVFCHFGCDTYQHNHHVIRQLKGWQQTGDEGYAYFTSAVAHDTAVANWLTAWMSWDQSNAFQPWRASLDHAFARTNARLSALGEHWRIV